MTLPMYLPPVPYCALVCTPYCALLTCIHDSPSCALLTYIHDSPDVSPYCALVCHSPHAVASYRMHVPKFETRASVDACVP